MKKHLYILFSILTIWSCSNSNHNNSNTTNTSPTKDSIILKNEANKVSINNTFPFGCNDLIKIKYPKHWEGHEEGLVQPKGKEFEDIGQCFQHINSAKTIGALKVNKIEIVGIGDNYKDQDFDSLAIKSIDSCLYRLPNIGIYECYYFYQETNIKIHGIYGNLLLLDPLTRNGKLLNIYFEYSGDQHINFRYFLANKDTIILYEGACYDDGCSLSETFRIKVNKDGKINIRQIKL